MVERFKVVIVGTGFSGLGQAIQLEKAGIRDYVILEKATEVGGTWRDNSYPGCACDVQSHMYSFSYEQNPGWSRSFSPQPEIFGYLKRVADKYRLREKIRFGVELTGAHWDERERRWTATTRDGREFVAQFLVSGVGGLHIPQIPELPGIAGFKGQTWHSARWNHEYDLRGKNVAVVGTGASAVQFVPKIAPDVAELTLFQRTPPWIMPKPDHAMPSWAQTLFKRVPGTQRAYRNALYWLLEARAIGFNGHPAIMKAGELIAKRNIAKGIKDRALRKKVTPDYTMGCKRVLISNDYYPALARPNVEVNTSGIKEVKAHSIVDSAGVEHEVDAIIYGTGFKVTDALEYLDITGVDGRNLAKEWASEGMRTHKGITVSGYPNLFFLLGPNTALGHSSVVFMIESQARYVVDAIKLADSRGAAALDVRPGVQDEFQREIQDKLVKGVWTQGGCKSWYLDAQGVNRTIWPGFTWRYWLETRKVDPADYELSGRAS
ncbi:flavin-binding monooxygenase-like protein [Amycolatopsis mediterranei S699]|uniref:Flavin-binding monooxygenase-like protein n=2 Tax=Amycolatopsis mediterranei TaxID=33910 RepID=A0A0H3DKT3_AMYMU|nr:NAD(P)/FAD-dependent oxidoreductase [Amycolatopsis mediterranei]ADJ50803.1 flavin-binding monooxygenase-like protein [Amycolatopsis mediterranei U32]AEK47815.1 flavin-binding monooxygenase-like protein [Amycolatopsis mediterranei S699]AFO82509.1 flavin-binding monooxygenase-like protein [Amycolatopsis mediterranei S699]AGT89638.1 flavin-binding monooxygenase-like protein [Amycolatopsis mediterranei RB]KDO12203.1 4-hydroxyacetophenone monooxygenase [Amycolatopsis mediterranei]